jgi:molybdate transport system permease protein
MISPQDLTALWITVKLAAISTALLLMVGVPIAWWLARSRNRFRVVVETVVAMPLVLPPTVLGFYLLLFLGPNGPLGRLVGETIVFSFSGLVIASMVYSLPFVVQPLRDAFLAVPDELVDAAATLGASPIDRFLTVVIPLARPGFLTATVLGFAHTMGEFGVALMIGGSIPGRTKVVSIAIYNHVETLSYQQAHVLSAILLVFSFITILLLYTLNGRIARVGGS